VTMLWKRSVGLPGHVWFSGQASSESSNPPACLNRHSYMMNMCFGLRPLFGCFRGPWPFADDLSRILTDTDVVPLAVSDDVVSTFLTTPRFHSCGF